MKGTELPAVPGPLSRSAETLPGTDAARAILPRKRRGRASDRIWYAKKKLSLMDIASARIRAKPNELKVGACHGFAEKRGFKVLWLLTFARRSFRKRHREQERR